MRALAFDLFGTLLDTSAIERELRGMVPDPTGFAAAWRGKQLEDAFLLTAMGRFLPFSEVTDRALRHVAARQGVALDDKVVDRLMAAWTTLPPFPDAREALKVLGSRYTLAVLSNADPEVLETALHNAGLREVVQVLVSAAEVRALKPSPKVYAHGAKRLGLPMEEVALVSSNGFDAIGAKAAGMRAIWVNRSGAPLDDLGLAPDLEVRSLADLPVALRR